jgi:hypothetical protein
MFNFGKRSYSIMKNGDKVLYFEVVDGKYVMPITSFSLYDNEGKSLTVVNQHFFMNQLINRLNVAFKKGYFSDDNDIMSYLNDMKNKIERDVELNKLFKGSLMTEIDEFNFEQNKRKILEYLDRFKFDTFINYNNVSIFSGSLEKNPSGDVSVQETPVEAPVETVQENVPVASQEVTSEESVASSAPSLDSIEDISKAFDFSTTKFNDTNEFVNSDDYFGNVSSVSQAPKVEDLSSSMVSSTDYFSQLNSANTSEVQAAPAVETVVETPVEVPQMEMPASAPAETPQMEIPVEAPVEVPQMEIPVEAPVEVPVQEVSPIGMELPPVENLTQEVNPIEVPQLETPVQNVDSFTLDVPTVEPAVASVEPVQIPTPVEPVINPVPVQEVPVQEVNSVEVQPVAPVVALEPAQQVISPAPAEVPVMESTVQSVSPIDMGFNPLNNDVQNVNVNDNIVQSTPVVENTPSSYTSEVMDRFNNDSSFGGSPFDTEVAGDSFGFEVSNTTVGDSVISDNNELPELENISSDQIESPVIDKADKKSHLGIIISLIVLVLVLAGLAYYLYKYVF